MKLRDLNEIDEGDEATATQWFSKHMCKKGSSIPVTPWKLVYNHNTHQILWSTMIDVELIGDFKELPYKCVGAKSITLHSETVKTMKNFPKEMDGTLTISAKCHSLSSLEGIPRKINGSLLVAAPKITRLTGIHKLIDEMNGYILIHENVTRGILGLLAIKGLTTVLLRSTSKRSVSLEKAIRIVNKYVDQGKKGLVAAQRELLDNDLDEFAEM